MLNSKKYHSLSQIQTLIQTKEINCEGLVKHYLERIEKNAGLNAFIEVFSGSAIEQAGKVDKKISEGRQGKLAGLIIGIKDNLCYKDHKVSAASKILEGFVSIYSSTVVERLIEEDAIIIGRLNCDEFAMGSSNENSAFGNVLNPHDHERVPGGSSGGGAAAVAAGLCLAALGTDTGGSIRQPASFSGIVGLKPTYGRVSRHGCIAYASSFDQIGPLTNNIEDAARILEVIAGNDEYDSTCSSRPLPEYSSQLKLEKKLKFAYINDCLESPALNADIKSQVNNLIESLRKDGHTVEGVDFPMLDFLVPAYYILTTAEASSNLSRYDGIHFGYRSPGAKDLESTYKRSRSEGFGKEVQRRIMLGTFVLSSGYYDAYYSKAQKVRRIIRDKTKEILGNYDLILTPTTPDVAFKFGKNASDPVKMYLEDIYTVQANLCGLPAISLPAGSTAGLPFGIQLMADHFNETLLFQAGNALMNTATLKNTVAG